MAIIFKQAKKKTVLVLGGVLLFLLFAFALLFFLLEHEGKKVEGPFVSRVKIDFEKFNHPVLQVLQLPPKIPEVALPAPRLNPFEEFVFPTITPTATPSE